MERLYLRWKGVITFLYLMFLGVCVFISTLSGYYDIKLQIGAEGEGGPMLNVSFEKCPLWPISVLGKCQCLMLSTK